MSDPALHVEDDPARNVGELLAASATRGEAIVLTGGGSVARAYELAASIQPDWRAASVWWGRIRLWNVTPGW